MLVPIENAHTPARLKYGLSLLFFTLRLLSIGLNDLSYRECASRTFCHDTPVYSGLTPMTIW